MKFTLYASRTDTAIQTKDFDTFKDCYYSIMEDDWYDSEAVDSIVFSNGDIQFQVSIVAEEDDMDRVFYFGVVGDENYPLYDALDVIANRLN